MSIGWSIRVGYISGALYTGDRDEAWSKLVEAAQTLARNPTRLAEEAERYGCPTSDDEETPFEAYCDIYAKDWRVGGPMNILFDQKVVHIMASGGDISRTIKETVAMAFIRLLFADMHKLGINIDVTSA